MNDSILETSVKKGTATTPSEAGYYFEAMVIAYLTKLASPRQQKISYDGHHKRAVQIFSDENISKLPVKNQKGALDLRRAIRESAQEVSEYWYNKLKTELEAKDIVINNTGGSNPIGDISITFDNAVGQAGNIILELKWQNSRNAPVKWFTLRDSVFNSNPKFYDFLKDSDAMYWDYSLPKEDWIALVSQEAFAAYLEMTVGGSPSAQLNWLLQKGNPGLLKESPYGVRTKYVVHGTKSSVSIQNLDNLMNELAQAASPTEGKFKIGDTYDAQSKTRREILMDALIYTDAKKQGLAAVGVTDFSTRRTDHKTGRTAGGAEITMYIANRLFK